MLELLHAAVLTGKIWSMTNTLPVLIVTIYRPHRLKNVVQVQLKMLHRYCWWSMLFNVMQCGT